MGCSLVRHVDIDLLTQFDIFCHSWSHIILGHVEVFLRTLEPSFGVVHLALGDKCSMVRAAIGKRSSPVERVYLEAMV